MASVPGISGELYERPPAVSLRPEVRRQRLLDGALDSAVAYMANRWRSEPQGKVTEECLQLFGGCGYMVEYPIARLHADARVQRIYGGANEIVKELIARGLSA
jgi:acyl-CoA dehydrogenase